MRPSDLRRFYSKILFTDSCWEWTGTRSDRGYSTMYLMGKTRLVHRVAFERFVGPLISGLVVDHLCRNRRCVRPSHLRQVTNRENVLADGSCSRTKVNADKTRCMRGHEFSEENTYKINGGGRGCRACYREHARRYRRERRTVEVLDA